MNPLKPASVIPLVCALLMSAPAAGQCVGGAPAAPAGFADASVSVRSGAARVGEPVTVAWSLPRAAKSVSRPAYLVVLLPDASRVDGKGFFALAAGAPNPAGVKFGAGRTRAVAPLHTAFAELSGEIQVLPYATGPVAFEWAVVGSDSCGEWIAAKGTTPTVGIRPGAPQITLRDEFADVAPTKIIRAVNGPYSLRVFPGRFEVYDGNALVMKRQGREPAFSPTGRFLIVKPPVAETFEIIDLAANRIVGRYEVNMLAWSHADSFLHVEGARGGELDIVRTLHGSRQDPRLPVSNGKRYNPPPEPATPDGVDPPREPKPPGLDLEVGGGGGTFSYAMEMWACDLSIDRGFVACTSNYDDNDDKREITVYDLGAGHDAKDYVNSESDWAAFLAAFGGKKPVLKGWNMGDRLWVTTLENDDPASRKETEKELKSQIDAVLQPTGVTVTTRGTRQAQGATGKSTRRGFLAANQPEPSSVSLIGAKLGLLPYASIAGLRADRDGAAMMRIQREIAPFYRPNFVKFRSKRDVADDYGTEPFPDPLRAEPPPPDEVPQLYLAAPGRDLWRWTSGGTTYWLTQTVESGRSGHKFSFTMLAKDASGNLRHADVTKVANEFDAKRLGLDKASDRFDQIQLGDARTDLKRAFGSLSVVGVSEQRYLAILAQPLPQIMVFDLASWQVLCAIADPLDGAEAVSVALHSDLRHLTQRNRDGSMYTYACPSGDVVLSGAYVDDEIVVMDRHGYFDGSEDAQAYVEIAIPGVPGRHLLSQFASVLTRPGIAAEVLEGRGPASPPAIGTPPVLRAAAAGKDVRLEAFSENGLDYIQIYEGGRPLSRMKVDGTSAAVSSPASAKGTAIAVDRSGLVSAPLRLGQQGGAPKKTGQLFALAVGVDKYPNMQRANLKFATADARRIVNAVTRSPLYAKSSQSILADDAAKEPAILAAIDRLVADAKPEDTIVLFFAGHGLIDGGGQLRLALSATELDKLESTALAFDTVAARLRASKARVVVLLDVCHAGLSDRAAVATNDAAVARLVTESGASMIVLSASKGRQFSEETAVSAGGRFSIALERIIGSARKSHDADGNGAIGVDELYRGLKASVVRETAGRQTPWLSRNLMVGDFDLF